jgi:hypothetical protein
MDGGSADHAGAVTCRPAGDPTFRRSGSYSAPIDGILSAQKGAAANAAR